MYRPLYCVVSLGYSQYIKWVAYDYNNRTLWCSVSLGDVECKDRYNMRRFAEVLLRIGNYLDEGFSQMMRRRQRDTIVEGHGDSYVGKSSAVEKMAGDEEPRGTSTT